MASLHALTQQAYSSVFVQVSMQQQSILDKFMQPAPHDVQLNTQINAQRKWTYLIADHVDFKNKNSHAIKLNKPADDKLYSWLETIIHAGQCNLLCVEELKLDELSLKRIKQLCHLNGVTLVNVVLNTVANKLLTGPWVH